MKPNKEKVLRRRNNTQRIINKRLNIIKNQWWIPFEGFVEEHPWLKTPGRVNKFNLRCGCGMCRIKDKHTKQELILKERMYE